MATAILVAEEEESEEEKEPVLDLFPEALPFDFVIRPNIPRSSGNGYFKKARLESNGGAESALIDGERPIMPKYVIERDIPNVGSVTPEQVIAISQKSCSVLNNLGPKIQ